MGKNRILNDFLIRKYKDKKQNRSKIEFLDGKDFKMYDNYESLILKRKDYVLSNLIEYIKEYPDYPIKYLLEKNQTCEAFFTNK
jgi:hypothetical protein